MKVVVHDIHAGNKPQQFDFESRGFSIGRGETCEVQLQGQFISRLQATVDRAAGGWELSVPAAATNGVEIDDAADGTRRTITVAPGTSSRIATGALIRIAHFTVEIVAETGGAVPAGDQKAIDEQMRALHTQVLRQLDLRVGDLDDLSRRPERVRELNAVIDGLADGNFAPSLFSRHAEALLKLAFRERLQYWGIDGADRWLAKNFGVNPDLESVLREHVRQLYDRLVAGGMTDEGRDNAIDEGFAHEFPVTLKALFDNVRRYAALSYVKKHLYDLIFELGPLTPLLECSNVSEVMMVSPSLIYIERDRDIVRSGQVFPNNESAISVIERIVAPLGRRIDRSQPLVDARLADGSRVNAVIEPLALKGPCVTIRRFPAKPLLIEDLRAGGSLNDAAIALLEGCVRHRCNMIVAGGTGSGKTTLLNALSSFIPPDQRLVTIEDAAELRLQQEHVVSLETRPPNAEGVGGYTTRDLVRNALRMRPDRIIVGECRGAESLDMLQAMNTGHSGSMTTLHANSADDVPSRLETLVLMAGTIPLTSVRRQIAEAIDFVVYIDKVPRVGRRVTAISEIVGLHPQTGEVEVRSIMQGRYVNGTYQLKATGYMPSILGEMVEHGHLELGKWFRSVRQA